MQQTNNFDQLEEAARISDERLTYGVIIRADADDIQRFKQYIADNNLTLVFKKVSMDNLYIINAQEYLQLQQLQTK